MNTFQKWLFHIGSIILLAGVAQAGQITLDGTLGSTGPLSGPNYTIPASAGQTRGGNLFHSFSQFNLSEGETATFTGPAGVHNVIARVTGGPSVIDGTIQCNIAGANLFIINPFGITFGQHSQITVDGSFAATTAHYLKLADGGRFDARNPSRDVLTAGDPSAFGFLDSKTASIVIDGPADADLDPEPLFVQVPDGKSIWIVGGEVQIHNRQLAAPAGEVVVVGCASSGVLPVDVDHSRTAIDTSGFANLSDLQLDNGAELLVTGDPNGQIVMEGNNIRIIGGLLTAYNFGSTAGGNINVTGRQSIDGDSMTASTIVFGDGAGGSINFTAPSIYLTQGGLGSDTVGAGHAGDIRITADDFTIFDSGLVSVSSSSPDGAGGQMLISVGNLRLEGANGHAPELLGATFGGPAGSISIAAKTIELLAGGVIESDSHVQGAPGGDIHISAHSLLADGQQVDSLTGVSSRSVEDGSGGGNIVMNIDRITLQNAAQITASSENSGASGSINIQANNVLVQSGASIQCAATSDGAAGNVVMQVERLLRLNQGMISVSADQTSGGDVTINVKHNLRIKDSSIASHALNDGGNVHIKAGGLLYLLNSSVDAKSTTGNGGNLTIDPPFVVLKNSSLVASAIQGNGGNILVQSPNYLTIGNNVTDASSQLGVPGTVTIEAPLIDLPTNLIPLQNKPLDAKSTLEPACSVRLSGGVSSFTVIGSEGAPVEPDGLLPAYPEMQPGQ